MGVPDCEHAVYHPAMTALKWTAAALAALIAFPAHADVSGPACVTDGDTLVVNGKRQADPLCRGNPRQAAWDRRTGGLCYCPDSQRSRLK